MTRSPLAKFWAGSLAIPLSASLLASGLMATMGGAQVAERAAAIIDEPLRYTANQLDNLVGPIALYPDALLAQLLVAATFPDQVEDAARFVRANGTQGIDDQSWDVSVKAVAHYASALNMMADKLDWTTTLGTAFANQSSDVMASVQRLRSMAAQQGNLQSTTQHEVINTGNSYVIAPTQSRVIYVPVYDPVVIYTRPVFRTSFASRYWSFGVGFPIGGWLSYDCDWGLQRVYYNGWNSAFFEYGGGWRARSRPFVQITNIYVNPRYRTVYVNRDVGRRPINYRNVDRYVGVHRDTYFDGRRDGARDGRDVRSAGRDLGRDGDRSGARGSDDDTGRTAQPRDEQAVLTPDGYRRGGGTRDERAGANDGPGGANRNDAGRDDGGREANRATRGDRPRVAMPQTPPVIAPPPVEYPRARPREDYGNNMPRQSAPRDASPRVSAPREAPQPQTRQAQPQTRQTQPDTRQAQPRQAQPRQSPPRESTPRAGGSEGSDRPSPSRTDSRTARGRIGG